MRYSFVRDGNTQWTASHHRLCLNTHLLATGSPPQRARTERDTPFSLSWGLWAERGSLIDQLLSLSPWAVSRLRGASPRSARLYKWTKPLCTASTPSRRVWGTVRGMCWLLLAFDQCRISRSLVPFVWLFSFYPRLREDEGC